MTIKGICLLANFLCLGRETSSRREDALFLPLITQKTADAVVDGFDALRVSQESLVDVCPLHPFSFVAVPLSQCFPTLPETSFQQSTPFFSEKFLLTGQDPADSGKEQRLSRQPTLREKKAIHELFSEVSRTFPLASKDEIGDELLNLNRADPRGKLLYFNAEADANGALAPELSSKIIHAFYNKFDMKYMEVTSYDQICEEIQEAAKKGKLSMVVINAHGWPDGMELSIHEKINRFTIFSSPSCFSGLEPTGKIFLLSCCTGAPGKVRDKFCFKSPRFHHLGPNYQPFAQVLADNSKRQVIAAEAPVFPSDTTITHWEPFMIFHPKEDLPNTNIFKVFEPNIQGLGDKLHISVAAEALKSANEEVNQEALDYFQKLFNERQGFDEALSVIIEALKSSDEWARRNALTLLKKLVRAGQGFETAIVAAPEAFKSSDGLTIINALKLFNALIDQRQGLDVAIITATEAFKSSKYDAQKNAIILFRMLVNAGQGFEAAIPAATEAFTSFSDWDRAIVVALLGDLVDQGQGFEAAIFAAEKLRKSSYSDYKYVQDFLKKIDAITKEL